MFERIAWERIDPETWSVLDDVNIARQWWADVHINTKTDRIVFTIEFVHSNFERHQSYFVERYKQRLHLFFQKRVHGESLSSYSVCQQFTVDCFNVP